MLRTCIAIFVLLGASCGIAQTKIETDRQTVTVTRMVSDLTEPWALGFLPDGGLLVTERDGQLVHIADGKKTVISGMPEVVAEFQGGLLDLLIPRDFAETREIFFTYSEPLWFDRSRTSLARGILDLEAGTISDVDVIFGSTASKGHVHYGSRVVEAPDGTFFLTVGERGSRDEAQNPEVDFGKIIRVTRDGDVPSDNPVFPGFKQSAVWSIGHRNPQGAALDGQGRLWINEHGAQGGDEVNLPMAGKNYGWPVISYGRHYNDDKIGVGTEAEGMEQPVHYWDPSIAPSGMMIYTGDLFPAWKGDIFVGSLKFDMISRLDVSGDDATEVERLFEGEFTRIRDIRQAPDGSIWFLSVGDGAAYRITPG